LLYTLYASQGGVEGLPLLYMLVVNSDYLLSTSTRASAGVPIIQLVTRLYYSSTWIELEHDVIFCRWNWR